MRKICKVGDCHEINQELNGELVQIQGQSTTDVILKDPEFDISLTSCIKLQRHVQQLQYFRIEHKHKYSSTTYIVSFTFKYNFSQQRLIFILLVMFIQNQQLFVFVYYLDTENHKLIIFNDIFQEIKHFSFQMPFSQQKLIIYLTFKVNNNLETSNYLIYIQNQHPFEFDIIYLIKNNFKIYDDNLYIYLIQLYNTYDLRWQREQICSVGFPSEFQNKPELMLVQPKGQINPDVRIGEFNLSESLKQSCFNYQYFAPGEEQLKAASVLYGKEFPYITIKYCDICLSQIENQNTVGDLRVSFSYVLCGNTTVISKQINNIIKNKQVKLYIYALYDIVNQFKDKWLSEKSIHPDEMDEEEGCCGDGCKKIAEIARATEEPLKQIDWIRENIQSYNDIFQEELIRNAELTYKTRLKAFSLMVFGVAICLQGIIDFGISNDIQFFIFIGIGMIFSIPISLIITLVAWMRYNNQKRLLIIPHILQQIDLYYQYTLTNLVGLAIVFSIVTLIAGGIYY